MHHAARSMRHIVPVVCHGVCCRHALQVIPLSCLKYGENERWLKVQPELVMKKAADEMQEVCRRYRRLRCFGVPAAAWRATRTVTGH